MSLTNLALLYMLPSVLSKDETKLVIFHRDKWSHFITLFKISRVTNLYLDSIFSNGFIPVITKPTRVGINSATLIDHIYHNDIKNKYESGIIINDVARDAGQRRELVAGGLGLRRG